MRFLIIMLSSSTVWASFCGDSSIPYSLEVLVDGQPVLGCARPTCFGWSTTGLPASHSASFYRIHKKPDGFLRKERASIPPFKVGDIHFYHPQTAECEESYGSMTCDEEDQWVGGIAPLLNVSVSPTALQCCRFEPLKLSVDRGIATVKPGQIVVGGEASKKGKQFAFDYISGLSKIINPDGTVTYEVGIRRFPCLPLPNSRAYQAPLTEVQAPVPVENTIEGPFPADNSGEQLQALTPVPTPAPTPAQQFFQNQIQPQTISGQVPPQVPLPVPAPPAPIFQPFVQPAPYVTPFNLWKAPHLYPTAPPTSLLQAPSPSQCCAPQTYYNPTAPGAYYCFSADTTVLTIENSLKRMDELKTGDWIQTIEDDQMVFSKVNIWLHKNPDQVAVFHKLTLEDGRALKLTGKHFLFKTHCTANPSVFGNRCNLKSFEVPIDNVIHEAVFAETVQTGDCLYTAHELTSMKKTRVASVEKVTENGIYSPLVSQGRLMVNGILASCHSVVQSNTLQQTFFGYVDHFFSLTQWLIGSMANDIRDLPIGMDILTSLMDQVLPKNLVTL